MKTFSQISRELKESAASSAGRDRPDPSDRDPKKSHIEHTFTNIETHYKGYPINHRADDITLRLHKDEDPHKALIKHLKRRHTNVDDAEYDHYED